MIIKKGNKMFRMTKELTKEEKLKQQISEYDRETLENKFISLFLKYEAQSIIPTQLVEEESNEPKPIINIEPRLNSLDFSNFDIKRRQQFLHKNYTNNTRILNGILNIAIEEDNDNLIDYLTELNKKLEYKERNSY